jgi:hypothetical protein
MTELRKIWIYDENGYAAKVDGMAGALIGIDYHHHEIHEGDAFTAEVHTTGGTLVNIAFATPAGTKRAHMTFSFSTESKAHLEVLEGATWTTNTGTVYAPVNQLRVAVPGASILLEDKTATPAYTANGVLLNATLVGAGTTIREIYSFVNKLAGGALATREELVLRPDETYIIRVTSDDGSKGLQLRLEWYEHTDSN